ncbi:MAG TPA: hypothetical protein VG714_00790 [Acidobacteriaceae bacterium]|nr:hypothetical protein [Acidobacteriaceae bacterium]
MLHIGPVAVDIPIDLQGLGGPAQISFVWELTRRPVDRALGALAPLADRIGAPTARFRNIVDAGGFGSSLGSRLFETYPAGSLKRLGLKRSDIITAPGNMLNEDETDAAICALTALPEWRLEGQPLADSLARQFEENGMAAGRQLPLGYVLLKANPAKRVHVSRQDVSILRGGTLQ